MSNTTLQENKAQEEAINTIKGRIALVSCPGSGKTTTLLRRIHHMLEEGVDPKTILMVTFTRAAAKEMVEKYKKMYGDNPGIWFATIHSLCFNILQQEGYFSANDMYRQEDALNFVFGILRHKYKIGDAWDMAVTVMREISLVKNNYYDPRSYKPESCPQNVFYDIFMQYEARKKALEKIDFDDMLIKCKQIFEERRDILDTWQDRFVYIQVDECQDLNYIQRDIIYLLAEKYGNLCEVGDDDQSIYRFRGAVPEIFLSFTKDFPNAKKIVMGVNYRSAQKIVDVSDAMIKKNTVRYAKEFQSFRGSTGATGSFKVLKYTQTVNEVNTIVGMIKDYRLAGVPYEEMAILFRLNKQALLPISTLMKNDIPFYTEESVKSPYDSWIFHDITAYAQLAMGTGTNEQLLRILNHPNRWLKEAPFRNIPFDRISLTKAASYLLGDEYWKYEAAEKNIDKWMDSLGPGKLSLLDKPAKLFEALDASRKVNYIKCLKDYAKFRNVEVEEYYDIYQDIKTEALGFNTIGEWLKHCEQEKRKLFAELKKKDKEGVTISTMHKAKGLEYKVVFILDCNQGTIPHKKSSYTPEGLEEERRLLYVGMTRAKDDLYIFTKEGSQSNFLSEFGEASAQVTDGVAGDKQEMIVPKYLKGTKLVHGKYGIGRLEMYYDDKVKVTFESGEKIFKFPEVFIKGFLKKAETEAAQAKNPDGN